MDAETLARNDDAFAGRLRGIVEANRRAEPEVGLRPRVTFLVKPGGERSYLKARWQASVGTNYPQSFHMVGGGGPRLPGLEGR